MDQDQKDILIQTGIEIFNSNRDTILENLKKAGKKVKENFLINTEKAFTNYYEAIIQKYLYTKTIINPSEPVLLTSIFVPINLKKNHSKIVIANNINNILSHANHAIITGIAGSGKSTILKYFFLNSFNVLKLIPIFIELRLLDFESKKERLEKTIYDYLSDLNFDIEYDSFESILYSGRIILFFDGFDEIPPNSQDYIEKEILRFRDKYSKNKIIISSRKDSRFISWSNFTEFHLESLSLEQAISLIEKLDYDLDIKSIFIEKLKGDLYQQHQSFLSNPLLLTIMLISFSQFADIPVKLHLFYQQAFEALFQKHDATKAGFKRERYCLLPLDEFQKVLSVFSFQSYYKHQITFTEQDIKDYLNFSKKLYSDLTFNIDCYFKDLLKSVCFIVNDGLLYTFSHRSFQEYFTAKFICSLSHERRKKVFKEISDSLGNDITFKMIFEMDRKLVEDEFLISEINKIKPKKNSKHPFEVQVFNMMFRDLLILGKENIGYGLGRSKIFDLFRFVLENYQHISNYKDYFATPLDNNERKEAFRKFKKELGPLTGKSLKVSDLLSGKHSDDYLGFIDNDLKNIRTFLDLPNLIRAENSSRQKTMEELFGM